MKWMFPLLPVFLLLLPHRDAPPGPPRPAIVRVEVEPDRVHHGSTVLPPDPEGLARYFKTGFPGKAREFQFIFAGDASMRRVSEMVEAAMYGEALKDGHRFPFNVRGREGEAFVLELPVCCGGTDTNFTVWLEFSQGSVALMEEDGGEFLDEEELAARLRRFPEAAGVSAIIMTGDNDSLRSLLPVLEVCQAAGAAVNLATGSSPRDLPPYEMALLRRQETFGSRPFPFRLR